MSINEKEWFCQSCVAALGQCRKEMVLPKLRSSVMSIERRNGSVELRSSVISIAKTTKSIELRSSVMFPECPILPIMQHEDFMQRALTLAREAGADGEIPVGALVVWDGKIIGRGKNQTERLKDVTAHAEMIALTAAANFVGAKYLPEATLYVTLEPCLMCCGALYWSKIGTIVYGAADEKNGYRKFTGNTSPFHPKTKITTGILADECALLMKDFFKSKR